MSTRARERRVCHERYKGTARQNAAIEANLKELGYGG